MKVPAKEITIKVPNTSETFGTGLLLFTGINLSYVFKIAKKSLKRRYFTFNSIDPQMGLIKPRFTKDKGKARLVHAWDIETIKMIDEKYYNKHLLKNCFTESSNIKSVQYIP